MSEKRYRTKSGRILTDADIEALADEAERGYEIGSLERTHPARRRAVFVYESARLQAMAVGAPIVPERWWERDDAFREQFVMYVASLCEMTDEEFPTPEQAHDSWWAEYESMGWTFGEKRDPVLKIHPDMRPFDELEQREQDKDAVFLALVKIARDWIRE